MVWLLWPLASSAEFGSKEGQVSYMGEESPHFFKSPSTEDASLVKEPSSCWLDGHGFWNSSTKWQPELQSRECAQLQFRWLSASDSKRCFRRIQQRRRGRRQWIHIIGDSSMRFQYAAWLSLFNGTQRADGFPLHTLPGGDACSFANVGEFD